MGSRMVGRAPTRSFTSRAVSHPSGATLNTPESSSWTTVATAVARSSKCTNCCGGSSRRVRMGAAASSASPISPDAFGEATAVGRKIVTWRSGLRSAHSRAVRSASAWWTANVDSGLGRTAASSDRGMELLGHAPYTIALETTTSREISASVASSRRPMRFLWSESSDNAK